MYNYLEVWESMQVHGVCALHVNSLLIDQEFTSRKVNTKSHHIQKRSHGYFTMYLSRDKHLK